MNARTGPGEGPVSQIAGQRIHGHSSGRRWLDPDIVEDIVSRIRVALVFLQEGKIREGIDLLRDAERRLA